MVVQAVTYLSNVGDCGSAKPCLMNSRVDFNDVANVNDDWIDGREREDHHRTADNPQQQLLAP